MRLCAFNASTIAAPFQWPTRGHECAKNTEACSDVCHNGGQDSESEPTKLYNLMQASPFIDRLVFSKVKARLGGRVRIALSGAAPLARSMEDFMRVCLCCYFIQGLSLYILPVLLLHTRFVPYCLPLLLLHTRSVPYSLPLLLLHTRSVLDSLPLLLLQTRSVPSMSLSRMSPAKLSCCLAEPVALFAASLM